VVENELLQNQKLPPSGLGPPNLFLHQNGSWKKNLSQVAICQKSSIHKALHSLKDFLITSAENQRFLSMFESWSKFHPRPPLNLVKNKAQ